jgi:type I restriction enzyme, S subunit
MANEWNTKKLADVIEIIGGGTPKTGVKEYWNGEIPWLSVVDFNTGNRWVSNTEKTITELGLKESSTVLLRTGDVIISARGTVGAIAQLTRPMAFNQSCYGIRGKKEISDTDFIYYALKYAVTGLKQVAHGAVFDTITRDTFRVIEVSMPPLNVQKRISTILGSIDAKIELNNKMNTTLEGMARALFQSWFVDFDATRNKLEGREPFGLDKDTSPLFPANFDFESKVVVPTGWKATTLGEVIEILDSKRIPLSGREREVRKGKYPYYGAASVMDYVDDYLFDGIYVLMGEDGSVILDDGTPVLQYVWGKFWANNHAHVLRGKNGISTEHILLHLKGSNIVSFVNGAVQPKLNQGNMKNIPFILPPPEISKSFDRFTTPLFAQIRANTDQSRILANLRDTLLPKLLRGELNVENLHP